MPWWYEFALSRRAPGPLARGRRLRVRRRARARGARRARTRSSCRAADPHGDPPEPVLDALRAAHARGARLVSICSGAFLLAAAGLLDGREAATHWRYAERLAERFPAVRVNADVLYVDGGDVLTSAGSAAGHRPLPAPRAPRPRRARSPTRSRAGWSSPPHRDGGQAQLIELPVPRAGHDDPIARAMAWALERLAEPLAVADLARRAHLSAAPARRAASARATGTSPGRWLIEQRVQASLPLLESGATSRSRTSPAPSASRPPASGATSARGWGSARLRTGSGSARHGRQRADGRARDADRQAGERRRAAPRRSGTSSRPGRRRAPRPATACRARRRGSPRRARSRAGATSSRTAAPVAKRAGGSDAAAALLRLGSVRPTPMPVRTRPGQQLARVVGRRVGAQQRRARCRARTACSRARRAGRWPTRLVSRLDERRR